MRPGLHVGDRIELRDEDRTGGQVVMLNGNTITVLLDDGSTVALGHGEFYDKTGDGEVPRRTARKPIGADDDQMSIAIELAADLTQVNTGYRPGEDTFRPGYDPAKTSIGLREANKVAEWEKLPEDHPFHGWSVKNLRVKRKKFKDHGVPGLLDQRKVRAKTRYGRQDTELVSLIREQLLAQADKSTVSFKTFFRRVERSVAKHNEKTDEAIECPSLSTVRRIALDLPEGRYAFSDATLRRSNNSSPNSGHRPFHAARPGDEVQIDATKLNCFVQVIYPGKGKKKKSEVKVLRPEIIAAVDVATRAVLAYRISAVEAKAVDAADILAKILTPEPFRPGWEERLRFKYKAVPIERAIDLDRRIEKAAKVPVVFPNRIVVDNGKVFLSNQFFQACDKFGISVDFARPRTGHDKAVVERFFGTLDARFLEHLQDYTGRAVNMKGVFPNGVLPEYTLEQLDDLFAEFIVNYHDMPHSSLSLPHAEGVPVSPNDMYSFLVATHGYLPTPASFTETIDILKPFEADIQQYGVNHRGRTFDSPVLDPFRNRENKNRADRKWVFRYSEDETRYVYFKDEELDFAYAIPWRFIDEVDFPFPEHAWVEAAAQVANPDRLDGQKKAIKHLKVICDKLDSGDRAVMRQAKHELDRELADVRPAPTKKTTMPDLVEESGLMDVEEFADGLIDDDGKAAA